MIYPFKTIAFAALCISLSGCEEQSQLPPSEPSFNETDADVERVQKTNTTQIRTYLAPTTGRVPKEEIKGVNCTAKADEFEVAFKSANRVALPVFKGEPSAMVIDCQSEDRIGQTTITPGKDSTIVYGASAAGLAALLVTSIIAAESDQWTYGNQIYVVMFDKDDT